LSVGQRQRIVLARIFLLQPQILILDEATSALDSESESWIDESIQKLRGTTTIIAIAHRLSTVMAADKVVVLDNGKIIEQGAPQMLAETKKSYFYRMLHIKESL
jgi:ATP-binding cassette subfamily C protein